MVRNGNVLCMYICSEVVTHEVCTCNVHSAIHCCSHQVIQMRLLSRLLRVSLDMCCLLSVQLFNCWSGLLHLQQQLMEYLVCMHLIMADFNVLLSQRWLQSSARVTVQSSSSQLETITVLNQTPLQYQAPTMLNKDRSPYYCSSSCTGPRYDCLIRACCEHNCDILILDLCNLCI